MDRTRNHPPAKLATFLIMFNDILSYWHAKNQRQQIAIVFLAIILSFLAVNNSPVNPIQALISFGLSFALSLIERLKTRDGWVELFTSGLSVATSRCFQKEYLKTGFSLGLFGAFLNTIQDFIKATYANVACDIINLCSNAFGLFKQRKNHHEKEKTETKAKTNNKILIYALSIAVSTVAFFVMNSTYYISNNNNNKNTTFLDCALYYFSENLMFSLLLAGQTFTTYNLKDASKIAFLLLPFLKYFNYGKANMPFKSLAKLVQFIGAIHSTYHHFTHKSSVQAPAEVSTVQQTGDAASPDLIRSPQDLIPSQETESKEEKAVVIFTKKEDQKDTTGSDTTGSVESIPRVTSTGCALAPE